MGWARHTAGLCNGREAWEPSTLRRQTEKEIRHTCALDENSWSRTPCCTACTVKNSASMIEDTAKSSKIIANSETSASVTESIGFIWKWNSTTALLIAFVEDMVKISKTIQNTDSVTENVAFTWKKLRYSDRSATKRANVICFTSSRSSVNDSNSNISHKLCFWNVHRHDFVVNRFGRRNWLCCVVLCSFIPREAFVLLKFNDRWRERDELVVYWLFFLSFSFSSFLRCLVMTLCVKDPAVGLQLQHRVSVLLKRKKGNLSAKRKQCEKQQLCRSSYFEH